MDQTRRVARRGWSGARIGGLVGVIPGGGAAWIVFIFSGTAPADNPIPWREILTTMGFVLAIPIVIGAFIGYAVDAADARRQPVASTRSVRGLFPDRGPPTTRRDHAI